MDGKPEWERFGFESHREWVNYFEAEQARLAGGKQLYYAPDGSVEVIEPESDRRARALRDGLPAATRREIVNGVPRRTAGGRQVGVKLASGDYELLAEAAGACGVSPSTLARVLVVRGARAIIDAATDATSDGPADAGSGFAG